MKRCFSLGRSLLGLCGAVLIGLGATACGELSQTNTEAIVAALQQVENAPYWIKHSGVRRYEAYGTDQLGQDTALQYTELIHTNGLSGCDISVLSVESPMRTGFDAFKLLQDNRESFTFRYRDFLIRDLLQFAQNYQIDTSANLVQVAGQACVEMRVQRKDGSLRYTVATELRTGLLLRYQVDELATGKLLAKLEYQSVDFDPNQSGIEFQTVSNSKGVLTPLLELEAELGAAILQPAQLPSGFALVERTLRLAEDGRKFALSVYSDGLESLFLLQGSTTPPAPASSSANVSTFGSQSNVKVMDRVLWAKEGSWNVLQWSADKQLVFVIGRLDSLELQALLESALN